MNRILMVIAAMMLCFGIPSAAKTYTQDCYTYTIEADGSCTINAIDYDTLHTDAYFVENGKTKRSPLWRAYDVVLPAELNGHPVKKAVVEPLRLASLSIPETLTELKLVKPYSKMELIQLDGYAAWWRTDAAQTEEINFACYRMNEEMKIVLDQGKEMKVTVAQNNAAFTVIDGMLFNKAGTELILRMPADTKETGLIRLPESTQRVGSLAVTNHARQQYFYLPEKAMAEPDAFPAHATVTREPFDYVAELGFFCRIEDDDTVTVMGWDDDVYRAQIGRYMGDSSVSVGRRIIPESLGSR